MSNIFYEHYFTLSETKEAQIRTNTQKWVFDSL